MREGRRSGNSFNKVKVWVGVCSLLGLLIFTFLIFNVNAPQENIQTKSNKQNKIQVTNAGVYFHDKCFLPHNRESCAPQYIIAGAMKCGTTSMFSYLLKHPEVLPLRKFNLDPKGTRAVVAEKEVRFFNDPNWRSLVKDFGEETAVSYYLDLFEEIPPPSIPNHPDPEVEKYRNYITGEATPMYICQYGVAQRIVKHLPFVKILIILRNPIDRSYSEYWFRLSLRPHDERTERALESRGITHQMIFQKCMEVDFMMMEQCNLREFAENPSLSSNELFYRCYHELVRKYITLGVPGNETKCEESNPDSRFCLPREYLNSCPQYNAGNSLYFSQLYEWASVFPRENIKYFKSEDLYEYPSNVMKETADFLGLSDFNWSNVTERAYNIVNPLFSNNREIITGSGLKKGLQIGAGEPSEYPPLDPNVRAQLETLFAPYNKYLAKLVGQDEFADW